MTADGRHITMHGSKSFSVPCPRTAWCSGGDLQCISIDTDHEHTRKTDAKQDTRRSSNPRWKSRSADSGRHLRMSAERAHIPEKNRDSAMQGLWDTFNRLKSLAENMMVEDDHTSHGGRCHHQQTKQDEIRKQILEITNGFVKHMKGFEAVLDGQKCLSNKMDEVKELVIQRTQSCDELSTPNSKGSHQTETSYDSCVAVPRFFPNESYNEMEQQLNRFNRSFSASIEYLQDKMKDLEIRSRCWRSEEDIVSCDSGYRNTSLGRQISCSTLDTSIDKLPVPVENFTNKIAELQSQRDQLERCLNEELANNKHFLSSVRETTRTISQLQLSFQEVLQQSERCPNTSYAINRLPQHIKGFCVKIQHVISVRIDDFARALGLEQETLEMLKARRNHYNSLHNLFWTVINAWAKSCHREERGVSLQKLLEACEECSIENPLNVKPMSYADRKQVEKNYSLLANCLMVPIVLIHLRDSGLLLPEIVSYVSEPQARLDRVERLVDVLPVLGAKALDIFIDALQESDQGHIARALRESTVQTCTDYNNDVLSDLITQLQQELQDLEIGRNNIKLRKEICCVPSGRILSGTILQSSVAVKILASGTRQIDTLMETKLMRTLKHDKILRLEAVCTRSDPVWIVTESVSYGNLLQYVRHEMVSKDDFPVILDLAEQISDGMAYLESRRVVHGDLWPENILIGDRHSVKIGNFGCSRALEQTQEYVYVSETTTTHCKAPEMLSCCRMSVKSDVWSFGILLYILVSKGQLERRGLTLEETVQTVVEDKIPQPAGFHQYPDSYFNLIRKCCQKQPESRPTFHFLHSVFGDYHVATEDIYGDIKDVLQQTGPVPTEVIPVRKSPFSPRNNTLPMMEAVSKSNVSKTNTISRKSVYRRDTFSTSGRRRLRNEEKTTRQKKKRFFGLFHRSRLLGEGD